MSLIDNYVNKLPFWQILSDSEKNLIRENVIYKKYQHNSVIYENNGESLGLAIIISGYTKISTISDAGREIILFKLKTGNMCVLEELESCCFAFHTQLIAESDVELMVINYKVVNKLKANNVSFRSFIYELVSSKLSKVVYALQNVIFLKAEKRLANYLLSEYKRNGSKTIRMTQEEIANEINSAREVVARMMKELVRKGCIDFVKRGELYLKNFDKLKSTCN